MLGQDPIEKLDKATGDYLYVHEIFYTLQGEGPFVGHPAIFIRLAGCTLQCFWCDTLYNRHNKLTIAEIIDRVLPLANHSRVNKPIIVLTGGEPFRQRVSKLVRALTIRYHFHVQFETAGTLFDEDLGYGLCQSQSYGPIKGFYSVVCSPKTAKVNQKLAAFVLAWKYIIREGETAEDDGLPMRSTQLEGKELRLYRPYNYPVENIYVSPCWEGEGAENEAKTRSNIELTKQIALQYGYRLSLQVHKMLGLP